MTLFRSMVITLAVSLIGAALGAFGGAHYVTQKLKKPTAMHELLHRRLLLTEEQAERIAIMEEKHAQVKKALEAEMRAANTDLARAFEKQHAYTPEVQAAIDRFHAAMGDLQKETIEHTFEMRSVLTPQQTEEFDRTVIRSLTEEQR